jgi:hypothetical protein
MTAAFAPIPSQSLIFVVKTESILPSRVGRCIDSAFTYPFRKIFGSLGAYQRRAVEIMQEENCSKLKNISLVFYLNVLVISTIPIINFNFETISLSACIFTGFLYFSYVISQFYEKYHQNFRYDNIKI